MYPFPINASTKSPLIFLSLLLGDFIFDFAKASEQAAKSGLYMLLDFSGSDWCGWCMKLEKEVFSQKDFKTWAEKNLVCVLVDFPQQKSQSREVKAQNEKLAEKYGVTLCVKAHVGQSVYNTPTTLQVMSAITSPALDASLTGRFAIANLTKLVRFQVNNTAQALDRGVKVVKRSG